MTTKMSRLDRAKDIAALVQPIVAIVAVLAAATWFLWRGEETERANITHRLTHQQLDDKWTWVGLWVDVKNTGQTHFKLDEMEVRLQQILPLDKGLKEQLANGKSPVSADDHLIPWPTLFDDKVGDLDFDLAPGEEASIPVDFVVWSGLEVIRVYTFLGDSESSPQGRDASTIYVLTPNPMESDAGGSGAPPRTASPQQQEGK
jgi:hypothetical protein